MKIKLLGWWVSVTWQPAKRWGYFYFWHDQPLRAFWIGHVAIEWWWR